MKTSVLTAVVLVILFLLTFACGSNPTRHKITLYSCGQKIGEWHSVNLDQASTYPNFTDEKSGKRIIPRGTLIIEEE